MLSREWRCSWIRADRRCSNYIWVINNFIALSWVSYIRCLTVYPPWLLPWYMIAPMLLGQPWRIWVNLHEFTRTCGIYPKQNKAISKSECIFCRVYCMLLSIVLLHFCIREYSMSPWWPLQGLLSWCPIFKSSYCNSFEDKTFVNEIYRCQSSNELQSLNYMLQRLYYMIGYLNIAPVMVASWHAPLKT